MQVIEKSAITNRTEGIKKAPGKDRGPRSAADRWFLNVFV